MALGDDWIKGVDDLVSDQLDLLIVHVELDEGNADSIDRLTNVVELNLEFAVRLDGAIHLFGHVGQALDVLGVKIVNTLVSKVLALALSLNARSPQRVESVRERSLERLALTGSLVVCVTIQSHGGVVVLERADFAQVDAQTTLVLLHIAFAQGRRRAVAASATKRGRRSLIVSITIHSHAGGMANWSS